MMDDLVRAVMGDYEKPKGIPPREYPKGHAAHHLDDLIEDDLVEIFAAIAHEAWWHWSKTISEMEKISPERLARWNAVWVPYAELPENVKEQDRKWARKYLEAMKS